MPRRTAPYDPRLQQLVLRHAADLAGALATVIRARVAAEVARLARLARPARPGAAGKGQAPPRPRRILPCIAPGCHRPSKGPRFHYLCDEHKGASRKDYEAWREQARTRRPKGKPAGRGGSAVRPKTAAARPAAKRAKRKILPCIAPGCDKPSKGPRFHYLCDDHKGAPRKDYEAWRKRRRS